MRKALFIIVMLLPACVPAEPITDLPTEPEVIHIENIPSHALQSGDKNAPVTLIVITEHHCKYCRQFQKEHAAKLKNDFINDGKLHMITVIYSLKKYPNSSAAAAALLCAGVQNRADDMNEILFDRIGTERIDPRFYAEELELDMEQFDACIENEETQMLMEEHRTWVENLGVSLVPTFIINGEKITGLPFYADLKGMIKEKISK